MKIASNAFEKLLEFHQEEYDPDRCDLIYQECTELEVEDLVTLCSIASYLKSPMQEKLSEWIELYNEGKLFTLNHSYRSSPYDFVQYVYRKLLFGRRDATKSRIAEKFPRIQREIRKMRTIDLVIGEFIEAKKMIRTAQRAINFLEEEVITLYQKEGQSAVLEQYENGW